MRSDGFINLSLLITIENLRKEIEELKKQLAKKRKESK